MLQEYLQLNYLIRFQAELVPSAVAFYRISQGCPSASLVMMGINHIENSGM